MKSYINSLSIVILTKDSQRYLREVLASASFADEILLLDGNSKDDTLKIAKEFKARVENQGRWLGFGAMKQKGVDLAKNRWVFILDSDEVIPKSLKEEILATLKNPKYSGYFVARLNYFFGKPLRYGGFYPDATIRLFDKSKAKFSKDIVHERVLIDKELVGRLKEPMKHYAYSSIEEFIAKQNYYSSLNAKPNRLKALINPLWSFIKIYLLRGGFLEGWRGFIVAKLYSQYTFWKYIKAK